MIESHLAELGYRIVDTGDRGGTATVYKAVDERRGGHVAIKVMGAEAEPARVRREAALLAHLDHPAVLSYRDAGVLPDDRMFLVSPWVVGRTLQQVLSDDGPLPIGRAFGIFQQLCGVLQHVHQAGVVHRDLSPRNVMITPSDSVVLIDFGLSRSDNAATITASAELAGTPRYVAPELIEGADPDARSDQYAAAVVFYESLAGVWPFPEGGTVATALHHQLHSEPTPLVEHDPSTLAAVDAAIVRALAKSPDERHHSMADFFQAMFPPSENAAGSGHGRRLGTAARLAARVGAGALVLAGLILVIAWADGAVTGPPQDSGGADVAGAGAGAGSGDPTDPEAQAVSVTTTDQAASVGPDLPVRGGVVEPDGPESTATTATTAEPTSSTTDEPETDTAQGTPVASGAAAALDCNLLAVTDFESGVIDYNYFNHPTEPDHVGPVGSGGADNSAALRVGTLDNYGLYGEFIEIEPGRQYVFGAWTDHFGEQVIAYLDVRWVDSEFNELGIEDLSAIPKGPTWAVHVTDPAPERAVYAVPGLRKDLSRGFLVADELVFAPLDSSCAAIIDW